MVEQLIKGVFILGQLKDNAVTVSAHKLNKCMSVDYAAACSRSSVSLRKESVGVFILNGLKRPNFFTARCQGLSAVLFSKHFIRKKGTTHNSTKT